MSYVRLSILGSSPGGEVWSINPVLDPTFEFPGTVDQTLLDQATKLVAELNPDTQSLNYLSTALSITGARAEVREDSDDSLIAISIQPRTTPLFGVGTPARGASSALVISLRTNTPGGSGRGRLYWPAVGATVDNQLRFLTANIATFATEMATYLHAMENAFATKFTTIGFDLAVRSKTTHTTPHVNKLQVGNVPDVQRRRRDSLVESYSSVAF